MIAQKMVNTLDLQTKYRSCNIDYYVCKETPQHNTCTFCQAAQAKSNSWSAIFIEFLPREFWWWANLESNQTVAVLFIIFGHRFWFIWLHLMHCIINHHYCFLVCPRFIMVDCYTLNFPMKVSCKLIYSHNTYLSKASIFSQTKFQNCLWFQHHRMIWTGSCYMERSFSQP